MRRVLPILALLLSATAVAQSSGQDSVLAHAAGAYEAGDLDTAETLLARIVGQDRRNAEAHHLLALVYAGEGPQHDARRARRHADLAVATAPDNPRVLETRLRQYQRDLSEERAFSMTDGRRAALARKILAIDARSALAHEERALAYFLEFDWRRGLANQRGGWDHEAERGMSGAANRALRRMEDHLGAAIAAQPDRASAYRLLLRAYATARDDAGLLGAARRMKAARPDDPEAALFFGLGLYRTGKIEAAEAEFDRALALLPPAERRRFEDIATLVHKDTVIEEDTAAFARQFWQRSDPRLLTPASERRLEHFARLALTDLLFTEAHRGRRGWESVRGEVAVRYGLPMAEVSQLSLRDGRFTRWVYDDFSLLFQDTFVSGDADFWSSAEGEDEATRARSLMTRVPERFDYLPARRVAFPFSVTAFRGEKSGTDVYVHMDTPTGQEGAAHLAVGVFMLDAQGAVVTESKRELDRPVFATQTLALSSRAGRHQVAAEFEWEGGALGFERRAVEVPAFPAEAYAMSDLLLAYSIEEEAGERAPFERNGFAIVPAPSHTFAANQPIYVYAEGYNLGVVDGQSRYTLAVTVVPDRPATGLRGLARRLFGSRSPGVGVAFEGEASGSDFADYVVLDASAQAPGPYLLTLSVRDLASGQTLERNTRVFIE